jgi:hypothetical protein
VLRGPHPTGFSSTWRRRAGRAAGAVREEALTSLRALRFTVHLLEGRTPRGHALRILYAGSAPYRHYLRRHVFASDYEERLLGRHWRWQLPALAARLGADLRITRSARALRPVLAAGTPSFYVPEWVFSTRTLDTESVHGKRKAWTGIASHGLQHVVTTDTAALCHFYERMYVPLMRSSHGAGAQLMRLDYLLRRVADGEAELLSIVKDGVAVGGCVIVYDGGEARLFSRGVLDADRDLLRQRVGVALYLYSFAHLLERGFARVSLGRARPFLRDGALKFKLERGGELTGATRAGIDIEPLNACAGAHEFLYANPWLAEDADGLLAVFFAGLDGTTCMPREAPAGVRRVAVIPVAGVSGRSTAPPVTPTAVENRARP